MSTMPTDLGAMIAADLSAPSAPLQGGSDAAGSTASGSTTASTGQTEPAAVPALADAPAGDAPAEQTSPTEEDDFSIDLDKEPEAQADAQPGDQEQKPEDAPADADSEVGALLATTRGKRIYAAFKAQQILSKAPEEGGIGYAPTVEQIKDFHQAFTDKQAMVADFHSGTPEAAEQWAKFWFGADQNGAYRDGALDVASKIPDFLAQSNVEAYTRLAQPVIERYADAAITRFMDKALAEGEPAKREQYYMAAQYLHHDLFGKYFDPKSKGASSAMQPQADAIDERLRRAEAAEQRVQQAQNQQRQAAVQAFGSEIDGKVQDALNSDIEQALAKIKDSVHPKAFAGMKAQFLSEVKADIDKNREAKRLFEIAKAEAVRTGDKSRIANLVRQYRQTALNPILSRRAEYITAAGLAVKSESDARHAQLQRSASKTAPASTGAPVPQDIRPALVERKSGESHTDWMRRRIATDAG